MQNRFRVWDGKRLLEFPDITEWDFKDYNDFIKACQDGGKPPLKPTGLLDKKEKEIWEGDICKVRICDDYEHQYREEVVQIKFEHAAFTPAFLMGSLYHDQEDRPIYYRDFEVLGNIYENPELLK